jgi:hypothetical protein
VRGREFKKDKENKMTYQIKRRIGRYGYLGTHDVVIDGVVVGKISARYKSLNSNRPYAYWTEVVLEYDAMSDETGFPNEYRTLAKAKAAVDDFMYRNRIDA